MDKNNKNERGAFMSAKITERVHVSLAPNIAEMLSKLAEEKGISRSAVIAFAIEKFFKSEKGEGNGESK